MDTTETAGENIPSNQIEEPAPEITPPKKARGRPRKIPIEETIGQETERKTRAKKKQGFDDADRSALAGQIKGLHEMFALMTGMEFLCITDKESVLLSNAIVTVADEYGLALSGKTGAFLQIIGTFAMVYGPRLMHYRVVIHAHRAKQQEGTTVDHESNAQQ